MTVLSNAWPQQRLDRLWELQKLARKAGNLVVVKEDRLVHVTKGGRTRSFETVEDAAAWHGGAA